MPTLVSIQIGRPETLPADPDQELSSKPWRTAFYKTPVSNPVTVGATGIAGDGQADRKNHGGIDKAVCVYSLDHCDYWKEFLGRTDFGAGAFGENLSVDAIDENDVFIGDTWQIGTATFEVSQPRQPCWKLARRWQNKSLSPQVIANGKTGWYLRVLEPGTIAAGDRIVTTAAQNTDSGATRISIAEATAIFYNDDLQRARQLAEHPKLSDAWREDLQRRL